MEDRGDRASLSTQLLENGVFSLVFEGFHACDKPSPKAAIRTKSDTKSDIYPISDGVGLFSTLDGILE